MISLVTPSRAKNSYAGDKYLDEFAKNYQYIVDNYYEEVDKQGLDEMLKTMKLEEKASDDDGDLLDDLKSDTIVGDASSIKQIIEEEKDKRQEPTTEEIDKSFYTTNFGLTKKDFEDLKDLNVKVSKTSNVILILLMIAIVIIIIAITIMLFS